MKRHAAAHFASPTSAAKSRHVCLAVLCAAVVSAAAVWAAGTTIRPDHLYIEYYGRWDRSDPLNPSTAWPGTGIVAGFWGTTSVSATFVEDNGNNRLFVRVDGGDPKTIRLPRRTSTQVLATGLDAGSAHVIEIVKKTEGCCGAGKFIFKGFTLDASGAIVDSSRLRPQRRLEFYGDSHAAGYSAETTSDSGDTAYKNAYFSYPAVTSRLLDAEFHNQAWSGIGIYKGYASVTMRQAYSWTLQTSSTPTWNFSSDAPDVVVVQLGDNDVYSGATPAQISQALKDFVTKDLRPKYPGAHIVLAATMGWDFNEVANYIDQVASELGGSNAGVSSVKLPWFSGQQHRVYCEQASHARILAEHIASQRRGWAVDSLLPEYGMGCLPEPAAGEGDVTLKNAGFESPLTVPAGNAVADGWRSFSSTGGGTAVVVTESGRHYLRLTPKRTGWVGLYQAVEHLPHVAVDRDGMTFRATARMRTASGRPGTAKLKIEFLDQGQNLLSKAEGLQDVSGSWDVNVTETGPAPAGTWHVRVVLVADTGSAADFDDVTLEVSSALVR